MAADTYLTRSFAEWTRDDALAAIGAQIDADLGSDSVEGETAYEANRRYVEDGDHWQEGDTWPMTHADPAVRTSILATAEPIFCSVDAVEKCVGRQVSGLLGTEPSILIAPVKPGGADGKPSDAQVSEMAAMREALAGWWDGVQLWERLREAARRASWSRRGPLRLRFLPDAIREPDKEGVTALRGDMDFAAALQLVYLSAPLPDAALLYTDERTQKTASIITYEDEEGNQVAEVWYQEGENTIRRILGDGEPDEHPPLRGARLPVAEIRGPLLVTDSVRRQQGRRDYFETILTRVVEAAGFRERYSTNTVPMGVWSTSAPTDGIYLDVREDDNGGKQYLLPVPRLLGNGVFSELQGRELVDENGRRTLANPSVVVIEPVDPEFAIKGASHAQLTILESCDQLHILDGDKAVSGYSKRQSRFNFSQRLGAYKGSAESAIVAILTGAIANAALMTRPGDPLRKFLDDYRISVTLKIDTGPLSAEEEEELMQQAERLFRSRSSVQALLSVEDAEAENAAILSDPIQALDVMRKRGEVLTAWSAASNLEAALDAAGVEGPLRQTAARTDFTPPEQ